MDKSILTAIVIGLGSWLLALIPIMQKNKELKKLREEVEYMASTGVAIGYYFNFIEMVYKIMEESSTIKLEMYDGAKGITEIREFSSDKVKVEVLIPRSLDASAFVDANTKQNSYKKGDILRSGNKRNFGVNYSIQDNDTLVIVDMPGPLSAVEKYLKKLSKFSDIISSSTGELTSNSDGEVYRKRQEEEISNFIKVVDRFIKDNQHTSNKVVFVRRT